MCQIDRNLLLAKLILFFWSAAKNSLLYYMPIQLKEIGLDVLESGIVYTLIPLLNFVIPPLIGHIGDKFGHYKLLNLTSILCIAITSIVMSQLPTQSKTQNAKFGTMFWVYFLLRVAFELFSTSIRVMNKATIVTVSKDKGGYGKQRIWYTVAAMIFNPLSGLLMTLFSKGSTTNYRPAFYLFSGLMIPLFITLCLIEIKVSKRTKEERKPVKNFIKSTRLWFFYLTVVAIGIVLSIRQPYFVMFYDNIKGPPYLLGLLRGLTAFVNLPAVYFSNAISKKFGFYMYVFVFIALFLKYLLISFVHDPWFLIPIFLLTPFSENFVSCANAEIAMMLAPPGYLATFVGLGTNANQGVGKTIGRFLGGLFWKLFNSRVMFRLFAIISVTCAMIVIVLYNMFKQLQKRTAVIEDHQVTVDETTTLIECNGNFGYSNGVLTTVTVHTSDSPAHSDTLDDQNSD